MAGRSVKYKVADEEQDEYMEPTASYLQVVGAHLPDEDTYVEKDEEQAIYENTAPPPVQKGKHYWEKNPLISPKSTSGPQRSDENVDQHIYGNVDSDADFEQGQELYENVTETKKALFNVSPASPSGGGLVKSLTSRFESPSNGDSNNEALPSNLGGGQPKVSQSTKSKKCGVKESSQRGTVPNLYTDRGQKQDPDTSVQDYTTAEDLLKETLGDAEKMPAEDDKPSKGQCKITKTTGISAALNVLLAIAVIVILVVFLTLPNGSKGESKAKPKASAKPIKLGEYSDFNYKKITFLKVRGGFIKRYGDERVHEEATNQCAEWNKNGSLIDGELIDLNPLKGGNWCNGNNTVFWVHGTPAPREQEDPGWICPTSEGMHSCNETLCFVCFVDDKYIFTK